MSKLTLSITKKEKLWGYFYMILEFLFLPGLLWEVNRHLPRPLSPGNLNVLFFLMNFLCLAGIFHRFLLRSLRQLKEKLFVCLQSAFLGFVLYKVSFYLLGRLILLLDPQFANINDGAIAEMIAGGAPLLSAATVFLVPFGEELLFRGLIFQTFYPKGRVLAYSISVLLFGFIHIMGYLGTYDALTVILSYLQYLPAGIFLCWAYERSDSIFAPILIHMTVNQLGILSMR